LKRLVIALQSLFSRKRLSGERVFLRPAKRRDAIKWQKLRLSSKNFLSPWEPSWDASSCSRRAFMRYLKNSSYLANIDRAYSFLIFKDEDKDLIGGINVFNVRRGVSQSASLGYWVGKKFSRKGYMNEALEILLPSLFIDLRLNRIEAATLKNNIASRGLLEKIGFVKEGICRSYLKINGKWEDHVLYSLLCEEYKNRSRLNQSN
jgi:ribosomal-protein-alanine N-acetyltransferase